MSDDRERGEPADGRAPAGGPEVLALFGPTGVGKTELALALARRLRARDEQPVAVSADAIQLYRGLEILSGAPGPSERAELEHRLVGIADVHERFSVARYARLAHAEIDALRAEGRRPLVVGGTGLYLRAALAELTLRPAPPVHVRARWNAELERVGAPALHARLAGVAPGIAATIAPADGRRIVRSLELHELGALGEAFPQGESELWTARTRHPTRLLGLVMEREALYARIEQRVAEMIAAGAEREVRAADAACASLTARQALGFSELLAGDVEAMVRGTRRYAKRQLTWMRKLAGVEVLDLTGRRIDQVAGEIVERLAA
ncbi:MAG TPA: tRNA (adenosine(37)-N6)-dimethylallyltransferase MiaA [Solirubrobacteraceae bacterium]|nr:tRNA (adenosine(37)-N6)-dimethylallyltransferase MiaA [Solirubrobacteraceae bacterium]